MWLIKGNWWVWCHQSYNPNINCVLFCICLSKNSWKQKKRENNYIKPIKSYKMFISHFIFRNFVTKKYVSIMIKMWFRLDWKCHCGRYDSRLLTQHIPCTIFNCFIATCKSSQPFSDLNWTGVWFLSGWSGINSFGV